MQQMLTGTIRNVRPGVLVAAIACMMAVLPATASGQEAEQPQLARVSMSSAGVSFRPIEPADGWVLVVTGPNDFSFRQEFWGEAPSFSLSSLGRRAIVDGSYNWEIRPSFVLDEGTKKRLAAARESGDPAAMQALQEQMRASGAFSAQDSQSGSFRIEGGSIVTRGGAEQTEVAATQRATTRDFVINDDLIVIGSTCVGFDCVNGMNFGFNTLVLQENNLRIRFTDTSSTASFPSNDWELTANDSTNGGQNRFSLMDVDAGRHVFVVEAGARSNALYVDDRGRVGVGTSTPVTRVHERDGNTPTLRLEQDGSSGFTPQTWDLAGNESNFFIRDVTHGSTLPFRIRPGAPTSAIDISGAGFVGMGTGSPSSQLHVRGSSTAIGGSNTTKILVHNNSTAAGARTMMQVTNSGEPRILFNNTQVGESWFITNRNNSFVIIKNGTGVTELSLDGSGNMVIAGTLTENSSREFKTDLTRLDAHDILTKAYDLPLFEWSYKSNVDTRHFGPMAEDFRAFFGLGKSGKGLAPRDVAAVALGAVQGLYDVVQENEAVAGGQQVQIQQLEQENATLAQRLEALEQRMNQAPTVDNSGPGLTELLVLLHHVPGVYPTR